LKEGLPHIQVQARCYNHGDEGSCKVEVYASDKLLDSKELHIEEGDYDDFVWIFKVEDNFDLTMKAYGYNPLTEKWMETDKIG